MIKRIILTLTGMLFISCGLLSNNRAFNKESWVNDPDNRYEMVKDLKNNYLKVGMDKTDVINLLGESEDGDSVYYLGNDGNYDPNPEFLVIKYKDDKIVSFIIVEG